MLRPGCPEQSWQCICKSMHMDLILSRNRLMPMMKPEPGDLVPALGGNIFRSPSSPVAKVNDPKVS
jgi:hypothetical protein